MISFKMRRKWSKGFLNLAFNLLYMGMFILSIFVITSFLQMFHFNALSIVFFIFFLSLVAYFGLRIRGGRRELVLIEGRANFLGTFVDIFFLPLIRSGRWLSMRAPRINIFLFFLDFIIEAPFKATIKMVEGWLAFLREKKEEI
jgi:hypothetical protein